MHSNKVVLDRESFKALSSGTRISILKALDGKRQTVTQLSKELEISKPALLKHLEALIVAKLVKKEGKERKWIYYDLAFKGKNLLHPERAAVTVLLSAAFASLAGAIAGFLRFLFNPISSGQLSGEGRYYAPGGDLGLSQSEGAGAQYYPGYPDGRKHKGGRGCIEQVDRYLREASYLCIYQERTCGGLF